MIATKRMSTLAGSSPTMQGFGRDIAQYKEESEKEQVDEVRARVSPFPPLSPLSPFSSPFPLARFFPNTCSPSHTVSDICIVVWTWLGIVRPWSDLAVLSIWGPSSLPSSHLFMSSFTLVFPF